MTISNTQLSRVRSRVLLTTSTYPRNSNDSTPNFIHKLACALSSTSYEIHVLAPHAPGLAQQEILDNIHVHRFCYAPEKMEKIAYGSGIVANIKKWKPNLIFLPIFLLSQMVAIIRLQHRYNFSVIHAHWLLPQGLCAALVRLFSVSDFRFVVTSHGSDLKLADNKIIRKIFNFIYQSTDAVSYVSTALSQEAVKHKLFHSLTQIIPMGIDSSVFHSEPHKIRKGIVCVARLIKTKGMDTIIESIAILRQKGVDMHVTVIGDGPEKENLRSIAAKQHVEDLFFFAGAMTQIEIAKHLQQASIFVSASHEEGLGLSIIEAMACGCAIVVSDIPSMRDIVTHENAILFQVRDADALSKALMSLANNDIKTKALGTSAAAHAHARFNWKKIAERFKNLYETTA